VASNKETTELISPVPQGNIYSNKLGYKHFELINHLGNILTTISDIKEQQDYNSDNEVDCYTAQILSNSDYYPFGVSITERSYNNTGRRYGFNGKENDEELETMDFGARLLDGDLGVWLACDPLASKYPDLSPYQFCANNPIIFIEVDGKYFDWSQISPEVRQKIEANLNAICKESSIFLQIIQQIENSDKPYVIMVGKTFNNVPGQFKASDATQGGSITFRDADVEGSAIIEEYIHAFQNDIKELYEDDKDFNKEFEAKTIKHLIQNESTGGIDEEGMQEMNNYIDETYDYGTPSFKQIVSDNFRNEYMKQASLFYEIFKNRDDVSDTYKYKTEQTPKALEKVIFDSTKI
jgi:RHS repeat-associated protein